MIGTFLIYLTMHTERSSEPSTRGRVFHENLSYSVKKYNSILLDLQVFRWDENRENIPTLIIRSNSETNYRRFIVTYII